MSQDPTKYGFVAPVIADDHYVLGAGNLTKQVLQPNGDWSAYLPTREWQKTGEYDPHNCTVHGTQNAIEMLMRRLFNDTRDYAERFNTIIARIRPPGADPHVAAENIRAYGLIEEHLLPQRTTVSEYLQPDPMTDDLLSKGAAWLAQFSFKHEWLWKFGLSEAQRTATLKDQLRYSPIGVSVTAWYEEDGVYVDKGLYNNHWVVLYGYNEKGWLIFDSYGYDVKVLSYKHNINFAKSFTITKVAPNSEVALKQSLIATTYLLILEIKKKIAEILKKKMSR